MTPSERGAHIREAARALGFDRVGIAAAGAVDDRAHFEAWLAAGHQGDMAYMETRASERADPRDLLPGAKSVVVVAIAYATQTTPGRPVARYAQGRDYHNPMRRRLRKLARAVKRREPETRTYLAVDTGPVLERYWAERAGIGWIGKASNLVTLTHSSWVLLGTLIIDRLCDYDEPTRDHCGTCDACIPVCPTRAILAPGVVDARLCISYLTIESRGGIPRELRAAVGDHLFGCDDCQEVCPWNRFAVHSPNAMLAGRNALASTKVEEKNATVALAVHLLDLDEATFVRDFEGTPFRRAGLTGMKRNALVVLGNSRDARVVPRVERVLEDDPSSMLRGHAAWALGRLGALAALLRARTSESDNDVREEIAAALQGALLVDDRANEAPEIAER
ncbi:MAG: tRNA epoxyqueuosine(34) reductase QueG [Deltaproteobacteria bacterium]|nr:tRNA epoxyqueuosine(34) reductase QueG [Deltaproteobacteria bacterium]